MALLVPQQLGQLLRRLPPLARGGPPNPKSAGLPFPRIVACWKPLTPACPVYSTGRARFTSERPGPSGAGPTTPLPASPALPSARLDSSILRRPGRRGVQKGSAIYGSGRTWEPFQPPSASLIALYHRPARRARANRPDTLDYCSQPPLSRPAPAGRRTAPRRSHGAASARLARSPRPAQPPATTANCRPTSAAAARFPRAAQS